MAEFEHLPLAKAKVKLDRRKLPAPIPRPERDYSNHSEKLDLQANDIISYAKSQKAIEGLDPALIMRAFMTTSIAEEEWPRAGFDILASDAEKVLVLFSSDVEMVEFKRRLSIYEKGIPEDQKDASYAQLFSFIEKLTPISPKDRIGPRFRAAGTSEPDQFLDDGQYILDLELWDAPKPEERQFQIDKLQKAIEDLGGSITSQYIGDSGWMLARAELSGAAVRTVLEFTQLRMIDLPPQPDINPEDDKPDPTLKDFEETLPPPEDAPLIGLIDSGMSANPLLAAAVRESFGVPEQLGDADDNGHGTKVGAICVYGDVGANAELGVFRPAFWLCSAKVVDQRGEFPKEVLVETQMREAITRLSDLGCRVINISLGDKKAVFQDGKVSHWAATLDELSRELNLLIVVSAGNASPSNGPTLDHAVTDYPHYLISDEFRVVEPSTACNVLTIGAIAHTNGLSANEAEYVNYRPICEANEPSPLSRTGPGINNSMKPDLVDYGGTLVFDGGTQRLLSGRECAAAGVKTLNAKYLDALFTSASGTSYATPLVTYKAALMLRYFPTASANLLRALLTTAADVPFEAVRRLEDVEEKRSRYVCGHGHSDVERALESEEQRVILYAEDDLPIDQFAIFEIPMLEEFRETKGHRHIRVTLAYDPPTRHTRNDYLGITMNFRLVRDMSLGEVVEFFRKRTKKEGSAEKLAARQQVSLKPGPAIRDKGTLQSATYKTKVKIKDYGDTYFLVVRCEGKWASSIVEEQRYAITVEMKHEGEVRLHQQLRPRLKV